MPLFYKQGDSPGVWKNVETPFMKQQGDWVEPEQVYIKKDGKWKLVFEEFTFVVETTDSSQTSQETILEGTLNDFENDFEAEDSFFFDQKLEQPGYVNATAVNESEKQVAVGGEDGKVYVFGSQLRIDRTSSGPTPSRIDNLDTISQPNGEINGLDMAADIITIDDDPVDGLAVASGDLFVYDENFNDINIFSNDEGNVYTDVEFNPNNGKIAASTPGGYVYIYRISTDDEDWEQQGKISLSSDAVSVSWRESDSHFAVGTSAGTVEVYNDSFNLTNTLSNHAGNVKVEFNGSGTLATVDENEVKVYSGDPLTLDETFLDSTEGPEGDVDWSGDGFLVHASTDKRIYVYDSSAAYELVKSFNNASRTFKSVSWDSENHQIVAGTAQNGSGEAFVYSTGAQTFFDWGKTEDDRPDSEPRFKNRQRASGLRATGDFQIGLDGLDVDTQYEFRAGGFAAGGRVVIDVEQNEDGTGPKIFTTANISVVTQGPTDTTSSSTTFVGKVDTFNKSGNIDVSFEWGEQGNGLPNEVDAGLVSGTVQFQENVDGLAPAQTYEYRAKAKFGGVTVRGSINTVTIDNVTANMVSSDPVDFGTAFEDPKEGQDTSSKNITIEESSGSGDGYNIENVSITGPDDNEFTVVSVPSSSTSPDVPSGTQENIDVRFEAINDGSRTATIEIEHDAPLGNDPLQVGLEGVVEKAVNLEVPGTTFTTTADQNEETKTFNINETGGDYAATITSIVEDNNQPGNNESSEWEITNRPGNLGSGGNATVPAGGTVSFEVGWNPDTGDAQDYNIVINYEGQGVPDSESEEITINGTVSGIVNIAVDPERDGNTSRGVTDGSFTYDFGEVAESDSDGATVEKVVPFSIVGDKDGDYTVTGLSTINDGDNDFQVINYPSSVDSGGQLVNITNPGDLRFDVVFDPTATGSRNADLEVTADNTNNNTHTIGLTGTGIQESEITTSASSLSFGPTIHGGNFDLSGSGGTDERTTQTVTISNASSDRTFDVTDDAIVSDDFEFFASGGGSAGTGTIDGGDSTTDLNAEIEFAPEPSEDYTDTTTVNGTYKISHDAEFGSNPTTVSLDGTMQVTALNYEAGGNSFDPLSQSTPDFTVSGNPNDTDAETQTFTIESDSGNDVATEVFISSPDNISTILSLHNQSGDRIGPGETDYINKILTPGDTITGEMRYDPSSSEDSGEIERVQVEWDNFSHDESIVVKGIIGSTINVETRDGSPDNETLAFTITENTSGTLDIAAQEVANDQSFDITRTDLFDNASDDGDGDFSVNNDFNGTSGDSGSINENVSAGGEKTATIQFSPNDGSAGTNFTGRFDFDHNADITPQTFEQSTVNITLDGTVLNKAELSMVQDSDGSTPINYSAEPGNRAATVIRTTEIGGDNDATISDYNITSGDASFTLNDNDSTDYTNINQTLDAGTSRTDPVAEFEPTSSTGSSPDYIVNATLEVNYSGTGSPNGTTTVTLEGEVIRPAKADISSSNPLIISGSGGAGQRGSGTYFEENLALDGSKVAEQEFVVIEENNKNSYDVTDITSNGPAGDNPYLNATTDSETDGSSDFINPTVTIPAGGSDTGTITFSPDSSGYFDNTEIQISHTADREGDTANDSVDGSTLGFNPFAEVVGDPENGSWTLSGVNYTDKGDTADGSVTSLPENCQDIFVQAENLESSGNVTDLSIVNALNGTAMFSSIGQRASIVDDLNGSQDFRVSFTTDTAGLDFDIKVYEVRPGEDTSNYPVQESDGSTPNGNLLASVVVGDGNKT